MFEQELALQGSWKLLAAPCIVPGFCFLKGLVVARRLVVFVGTLQEKMGLQNDSLASVVLCVRGCPDVLGLLTEGEIHHFGG